MYTLKHIGLTKQDLEAKFPPNTGKVGIVYVTKEEHDKHTLAVTNPSQYDLFVFVMAHPDQLADNDVTYDGMEINGKQVLAIDELPDGMYAKLLNKCAFENVPPEIMSVIQPKPTVAAVDKMKTKDLIEALKAKGITRYIPKSKSELVQMYNATPCDPVQGVWCNKPDEVCDLRNNLCMPKDSIKSTKKLAMVFDTVQDHPVAGTNANLADLKSKMTQAQPPVQAQVPVLVPQPTPPDAVSVDVTTFPHATDIIKVGTVAEMEKALWELKWGFGQFYEFVMSMLNHSTPNVN